MTAMGRIGGRKLRTRSRNNGKMQRAKKESTLTCIRLVTCRDIKSWARACHFPSSLVPLNSPRHLLGKLHIKKMLKTSSTFQLAAQLRLVLYMMVTSGRASFLSQNIIGL